MKKILKKVISVEVEIDDDVTDEIIDLYSNTVEKGSTIDDVFEFVVGQIKVSNDKGIIIGPIMLNPKFLRMNIVSVDIESDSGVELVESMEDK